MFRTRRELKAALDEIVDLRISLWESYLVLKEATSQRDKQAAELAQIKSALSEVAVYEGMVGVSPVAMLVSELVRDHEELEARIDSVVMLLKGAKEAAQDEPTPLVDEVARLLQGGERIEPPESLSFDA